jgi:magnesium-transporting ATPase (P-type)
MEAFKRMVPLYTAATRDGNKTVFVVKGVVLADMAMLCTGSHIPADSRIVEAYSSLTGVAQFGGYEPEPHGDNDPGIFLD